MSLNESMKLKSKEIHLKGTPICQGIAIGRPYFYVRRLERIPEFTISKQEISKEILRYRNAIQKSKSDVQFLQMKLQKENVSDGVSILEAHFQIMEDPMLTIHVEEEIERTCKNAEHIFYLVIQEFQKKFLSMTDPFFQERFQDIEDISRRILRNLNNGIHDTLPSIPVDSIVFAKDLIASDAAEANCQFVKAFVTEFGGVTSHAAIVSKAKGIPYISNISLSSMQLDEETTVIVDGRTGDLIIHPTLETIEKYRELNHQIKKQIYHLEKSANLAAETIDGYRVALSANVEMVGELDLLQQHNGSGVGLFRSEYLFLTQNEFPLEEEQFEIYRTLAEKMKGLPIVIRTFDVGGDKCMPNQKVPIEENPFLGCRAIRFLLKEPEIFKTQLRAILRASAYGDVSLMFPMVSTLTELLDAKKVVQEVIEELKQKGVPLNERIRIGCMIEVPSAAIIADLLAKECDFLSIGTNDLVQYSLAVDRSNHAMSGLYTPAHPSVIRLIRLVVAEAQHQGIPVTVCGEVAADPRFTPLLLGLGVNELSVTLRYLPIIKNVIRRTSILAASQLAEKVLALSTPQEIEDLLTKEYQKNNPEDHLISNYNKVIT